MRIIRIAVMTWRFWRDKGLRYSLETALRAAQAQAREFDYAYLTDAIPAEWAELLPALGCRALHCRADELDVHLARSVIESGILLACFTVNDRRDAAQLFMSGVSAVFSDRPDLWDAEEM